MTPSPNQDPTTANSELREKVNNILGFKTGADGITRDDYDMASMTNRERVDAIMQLIEAQLSEARQANAAQFEDILIERDARVERETRLDEARYWDEHVMVGARSVVVNDRAKARLAQLNPQKPGEEEV